jgi:hypothetical protein
LQQNESFVSIKKSSSSFYIFWTKKQDLVDDKHLKTLKQIDRENAKNERQSFKTWFETLSQMREHEMKMRMKDNFVNVLNRMISIKSTSMLTLTSTSCYSWSQSVYQSLYAFSSSSLSSSSSEYSIFFSSYAFSYLYFYLYSSFSSSSQQSSSK